MKIEFSSVLEELEYMLEHQVHINNIYRVDVDLLIRIRDELQAYESYLQNASLHSY